jgi:hypothetical protein
VTENLLLITNNKVTYQLMFVGVSSKESKYKEKQLNKSDKEPTSTRSVVQLTTNKGAHSRGSLSVRICVDWSNCLHHTNINHSYTTPSTVGCRLQGQERQHTFIVSICFSILDAFFLLYYILRYFFFLFIQFLPPPPPTNPRRPRSLPRG